MAKPSIFAVCSQSRHTVELCVSVLNGTGQRAHAHIMRFLLNEYGACLQLIEVAVYLCILLQACSIVVEESC